MVGPHTIKVFKRGGTIAGGLRYLNLEIDNEFPRCLMISDDFVQELSRTELFDDL